MKTEALNLTEETSSSTYSTGYSPDNTFPEQDDQTNNKSEKSSKLIFDDQTNNKSELTKSSKLIFLLSSENIQFKNEIENSEETSTVIKSLSNATYKEFAEKLDFDELFNIAKPLIEVLKGYDEIKMKRNRVFTSSEVSKIKRISIHQKQLLIIIKDMLKSGKFPSIVIKIGMVEFFCHLAVLQIYSPIFRNLIDVVVLHLPPNKVSCEAFAIIYRWMLDDKPTIPVHLLLQVFHGAVFLKVQTLINQCWYCFDTSDIFREDAAFILYMDTKKYIENETETEIPVHMKLLQNLLLSRVNKFFLVLVASNEFLQLNLNELCQLLRSNLLGVHSELEVFLSAVRWLDFDWEKRKDLVMKVMKCVRFGLLPPWFVVGLQKGAACKIFMRLLENKQLMELLREALSYVHIVRYYGSSEQTLHSFKIESYFERHWVIDRESSQYYVDFFYAMKREANYKHFEKYITEIQKRALAFWPSLKYVDEDNVLKHPKNFRNFLFTQNQ